MPPPPPASRAAPSGAAPPAGWVRRPVCGPRWRATMPRRRLRCGREGGGGCARDASDFKMGAAVRVPTLRHTRRLPPQPARTKLLRTSGWARGQGERCGEVDSVPLFFRRPTKKRTVSRFPPLFPSPQVIGVGGGGSNAVNRMLASDLRGVDLYVINTDAQVRRERRREDKKRCSLKTTTLSHSPTPTQPPHTTHHRPWPPLPSPPPTRCRSGPS